MNIYSNLSLTLTFRKIALISTLYLLIGGLCGILLNVPSSEILLSFLSVPTILLVPMLIGLFCLSITHLLEKLYTQIGFVFCIFLSWCLGIITLICISMISQYLGIFSNLWLILILSIACIYNVLRLNKSIIIQINQNTTFYIIIIFIFSLISFSISSSAIPYPLFGLGHDAPAYLSQPVLRAIENNYFTLSVQNVDMILSLMGSLIFNIHPDGFLWFSRYFLQVFFSIGVYLFVKQLSKNNTFSLISALIAPYLLVGSQSTYMLFFDIPIEHFRSNTILFMLFPYVLYLCLKFQEKFSLAFKKSFKELLAPLLLTICMFFYFNLAEHSIGYPPFYKPLEIDPIAIPFIAFFVTFFLLFKLHRSIFNIGTFLSTVVFVFSLTHRTEFVTFISVILLFVVFLSFKHFNLKICVAKRPVLFSTKTLLIISSIFLLFFAFLINQLVVPNMGKVDLDLPFLFFSISSYFEAHKFSSFFENSGYSVIFLLLLGFLLLLKKRDERGVLVLSIFSLVVFLFFFPLGWTYRLYKVIVPFMAVIIAVPIANAFNLIKRFQPINIFRKTIRFIFLFSILILVFTSLIYPIFNRYTIRDASIPQADWQSNLSYAELEAANFIAKNTSSNSILISDPFTVWTLTPISNRLWITEKWMNIGDLPVYHYSKGFIFNSSSAIEAYNHTMSIDYFIPFSERDFINHAKFENTTKIIIISSRTISWMKSADYPFYCFYSATEKIDKNCIQQFFDQRYFTLLYSIDDNLFVFEAKITL